MQKSAPMDIPLAPLVKVKRQFSLGFTLIELLVVIVLLGIIASMAAPSMRSLIVSQRVRSANNDMHTTLLYARSEAMKRGQSVTVSSATGGWAAGWTVQTDIGGTSTVLQRQDALDNSITVSNPLTTITLTSSGRPSSASAGTRFTFYSSGISSITARCVALSLNGMPQAFQDTDGNPTNGCQ